MNHPNTENSSNSSLYLTSRKLNYTGVEQGKVRIYPMKH